MKFLLLESVDSTNSYVSAHSADLEDLTMVIADSQTAGRGQRGNSWESEPGKNLTFTLLYRPKDLKPIEQFSLSEATALAMTDYLHSIGLNALVKWPNDIYVDNRKISGILIEHSITSRSIEHTRIGVGLNINQWEFRSDAPNPVSIYQLLETEFNIGQVAAAIGACIERRLRQTETAEGRVTLHDEFRRNLWRGDGNSYPFREREGGVEFAGIIKDVETTGPIKILNTETGQTATYAFKEVEFRL